MKKKLVAIGLLSLLTLNVPAFAAPHGGHHNCGHSPAPVRVAPAPHHHCNHFGISFSTGVLARRSYWSPYDYGYYPIGYPYMNGYYAYPPCHIPNMYVNVRL